MNAATTRASAGLIASLSKFSSCEIADVLVKLKHPHGGYLPDINLRSAQPSALFTQPKLCGEAFTVQMVPATDTHSPRPPEHYVDAAEKDSVMVISSPLNSKSAVWGGLMTARAQTKGVKGVIIDGRCRDLAEHREAGFLVFARGHSVLGQSTFTRPSQLQVPITIHPVYDAFQSEPPAAGFPPVVVRPYDIIVGDEDGVVVVPKEDAESVVELCEKHVEIDKRCLEALKAGESIADTFAKFRGK